MFRNNIKTDFSIFRFDEENDCWQKYYLPQFTALAESDYQNSRGFGNDSPFFTALNQSLTYQNRSLQTLADWQKSNLNEENYTKNSFIISQNLIQAIGSIHRRKKVLGSLSANNILISDDLKIWFSEWSFLSENDKKWQENSVFLETSLIAYLATELSFSQKTNLNYKTDLYALGVVLYQLFTRINPFSSANPLDSIYKHRTLKPAFPTTLNPQMGEAMGQIILSLVEKNPDNRIANIELTTLLFDNAYSLFSENQLDTKINIVALTKQHFSIQNPILENYQTQQHQLFEFYEESQLNNFGSVVFLSGKNGVQKSQFVNQFFLGTESADVLSIILPLKNDQTTPLSSVREMLKTITNFYLTRPIDELINFQNIAQFRLGAALGILREIYAPIVQVLPFDTDATKAKGLDLKRQLIFALAELLKSFIQSQKKLQIHFRGFHFTTNNTLGIIEGILKELPLEKLFFIFTYDEELVENFQQNFIDKALKDSSNLLTVNQLVLEQLQKAQVYEALKNASVLPSDIDWVCDILMAKTNGLPNFLNRIIEDLAENEKVSFDTKTNFWRFEKEALLASRNYSGGMVGFYSKQLKNIDEPLRELLFYASLIGDTFSKNILAEVYSKADFEANFEKILQQEIIRPLENTDNFTFSDLEFRKTCLELFKPQQIQEANLLIIKALLKLYPEVEKSEYFYIFLNKLLLLPPNDAKIYQEWIILGYGFCQKIADFDLAFRCSVLLSEMITEEDWQKNQSGTFQIQVNYLRSCYLVQSFEKTEELYQKLLPKAKTDAQYLYLTWEYSDGLSVKQNFKKSMSVCIEALKRVNISISDEPSMIRIIYSSVRMGFLMKGKDLTFFKNLPPIVDETTIYKILILQSMVGSAFIVNPKMISELIYKQADFSIKNGFSLNLGICMACFAFTSANFQGKYDESKYFFDLGQNINEIVKDSRTQDVNMFIYSCFIQPWFESFKVTSQQLIDNFYHCRQSGFPYFASYNTTALPVHLLFGEVKIQEIKSKLIEVLPFIYANLPKGTADNLILINRFCNALANDKNESDILKIQTESFEEQIKRIETDTDITKKNFLYNQSFYLSFINNEYSVDRAVVLFCKEKYEIQGKGFYQKHINFYFISINYLKISRKLDRFEKNYVKQTITELNQLSTINPQNFETKAFFLNGLNFLREKQHDKANLYFQKTLESAIKYEQFLTAGLVARELGELSEKLNLSIQSLGYFNLAIKYFDEYGANILVEKLLKKYPILREKNQRKEVLNLTQKIDLQSFINSSTSISAEIKLDSLLAKMMVILVENAGAENVNFIVPNEQGFQLIASKTQAGIDTNVRVQLDEKNIPLSILHYVLRSQKYVLLENASQNPIYKNDIYIKTHTILSVLCLPVVKNKQLLGIIYLENNLLAKAFTHESTETLNLLASQIAVSFENSQLYDNMEKKVLERTNELLIEKDKSEKLLLNILPSEVAQELKELGHSEAKLYNHVTVLFADFVGFTKLSENLSPKELIDEVDEYFKAFDLIMEEFGLEKIKTIGDAYLSVCGLPNIVENHAHQAAKASKAIMNFVENKKQEKIANNHIYFDIRIGLHSGPVIAGIVGLKKFAYDIWGDTVNTAARMEQASEPNKINLSATTFNLIKTEFGCQYRGKIEAKNKGEIDMYFLD